MTNPITSTLDAGQQKIAGDALQGTVVDLIDLCCSLGIVVMLENPASSRIFLTREVKDLIARRKGKCCRVDYCKYNRSWCDII